MAEVLTVSAADQDFGSPLKRSASQPSLLLDTEIRGETTADNSDYKTAYRLRESSRSSASVPSSTTSSPLIPHIDFSNRNSCLSTPSSSLSLNEHNLLAEDEEDGEDEDLRLPAYDSAAMKPSYPNSRHESLDVTPRASPVGERAERDADFSNVDPPPRRLSRTESTSLASIADDTAAKPQPTRHVDYLSHNWKEEDIWSSWRHVVEKRGCLDNWERLENASWRTWMKTQQRLSTINPDKLNWMKDHDVTWLYGPLQPRASHVHPEDSALRCAISRTNSFVGKKPILKKRSVSEVMLQRSISSQSLMRQATDSIRAQEATSAHYRPRVASRGYSDIVPRSSPVDSRQSQTIPELPSPLASSASSDVGTPDDSRHIHFNETVEQCIAISSDSDEPDYDDDTMVFDDDDDDDDHSSDEEFLTMKTDRSMERKLSRSGTARSSFSDGTVSNKTIAMLPATTLKYRSDTPELPQLRSSAFDAPGHDLRESSSQETLRPTRPHANFLLDDEGDDYDLDPEWMPSTKHGQQVQASGARHHYRSSSRSPQASQISLDLYRDDTAELQHPGMRRTPSGMFMPYEDGDEAMSAEGAGLLGKVVDTYNTARDIAHVIWNVGWRR